MDKDTVIKHYEHTLEWVQSLTEVTEEEWRSAIADGKWSIAEIIAHFVPWDEFILHDRLKQFWNDRALCKAPDVHEMNRQSAKRARHEARRETIGRFIAVRTELLQEMNKIEASRWTTPFLIGQTELTLSSYFKGLIKHDLHHMEQVKQALSTERR